MLVAPTKDAGVMGHLIDKCTELALANILSKGICGHPSKQLQVVSVLNASNGSMTGFLNRFYSTLLFLVFYFQMYAMGITVFT